LTNFGSVLKKQRRHIKKKQLKLWYSMGISSGQVWDTKGQFWHTLNWMVEQMKKKKKNFYSIYFTKITNKIYY
jgi:hypothetical protein